MLSEYEAQWSSELREAVSSRCMSVLPNNFIHLSNQEEDEVPDDETLNQMIARREEEFDLFMVRMGNHKKIVFSSVFNKGINLFITQVCQNFTREVGFIYLCCSSEEKSVVCLNTEFLK